MDSMDFSFDGPVVEWRGPAPFYFLAIPQDESADIKFAAKGTEYWGQVPVRVRIKGTESTTALFPKDGRYLLPLKDVVRKSAGIEVGQLVTVAMSVGPPWRNHLGAQPAALKAAVRRDDSPAGSQSLNPGRWDE